MRRLDMRPALSFRHSFRDAEAIAALAEACTRVRTRARAPVSAAAACVQGGLPLSKEALRRVRVAAYRIHPRYAAVIRARLLCVWAGVRESTRQLTNGTHA